MNAADTAAADPPSRSRRTVGLLAGSATLLALTVAVATTGAPGSVRSTTTSGSPVTSTTLPPPRTIAGAPLLGEVTGLRVLLLSFGEHDGSVDHDALLDLDSGQLTALPSGTQGSGPSGRLLPFDHRLIYLNLIETNLRSYAPDGAQKALALTSEQCCGSDANAAVIAQRALWLVEGTPTDRQAQRVVARDVAGGGLIWQHDIEPGFKVVGTDADSRVVVSSDNFGTYAVDRRSNTFVRLSSRSTLAAQGDVRVERACDEQFTCHVAFVSPSRPDLDLWGRQAFDLNASLSPNGAAVVLGGRETADGPLVSVVIDTQTGIVTDLGPQLDVVGSFSWTPDGMWLLGVQQSRLMYWRTGMSKPKYIDVGAQAAAIGVFPG